MREPAGEVKGASGRLSFSYKGAMSDSLVFAIGVVLILLSLTERSKPDRE